MREEGWVELGRGRGKGLVEGGCQVCLVLDEERVDLCRLERVKVAAAVEGVHVSHHSRRSVDSGPSVGKEFLGPPSKEVAGSAVSGDFLNCVAVANPEEPSSPNVGADDAECPRQRSDRRLRVRSNGAKQRRLVGGGLK